MNQEFAVRPERFDKKRLKEEVSVQFLLWQPFQRGVGLMKRLLHNLDPRP
jgi:hypothetical protein